MAESTCDSKVNVFLPGEEKTIDVQAIREDKKIQEESLNTKNTVRVNLSKVKEQPAKEEEKKEETNDKLGVMKDIENAAPLALPGTVNENIEHTKKEPPKKETTVITQTKKIATPSRIDLSPFNPAEKTNKRVKLFLWGKEGTGKTLLALHFPSPVIIDLERGSEQYYKDFKFDILPLKPTNQIEQINKGIDFLLKGNHKYKTLIVDPITILWEMLQEKWNDIFKVRNKKSAGFKHEFYDFQVKDWQTVKAEAKYIIRKLIALDMNVVVTAREKPKYRDDGFMISDGETFDAEKSIPYMFDTILRLYINGKGVHCAHVVKDRSMVLRFPKEDFKVSYEILKKGYGEEYLERDAEEIIIEEDGTIETTVTKVAPSKEVQNYLITKEDVTKLKRLCLQLKLGHNKVMESIKKYGVSKTEDLSKDNAKTIIEKLEAAVASVKK